jgi:hypothetical protein
MIFSKIQQNCKTQNGGSKNWNFVSVDSGKENKQTNSHLEGDSQGQML